MKNQIIALIIISLAVIDLFAIGQFNVVVALYDIGAPVIAPLILGFIGIILGLLGIYLLVTG